MCIYRKKTGFGTIHGFRHSLGSWNIFSVAFTREDNCNSEVKEEIIIGIGELVILPYMVVTSQLLEVSE
jgi:hypothetical protein